MLEWSTLSDINNDYFTIERSKDGLTWKDVNQVKGAGNSTSIIQYTSTNSHPFQGISYYRLKQTDYDGRSTHSKIKSIQNNHDVGTYLYPNPAHDIITLSLGEEELKINAFKLIDVSGKDQSQRVHLVSFHENEITFDLTLLPQGVYYFKYNQFVKKLIKL